MGTLENFFGKELIMRIRHILAAVGFAAIAATHASAAVISAVGASEYVGVGPGTHITNNAPGSNTEYLYINEAQGVTLGSALTTDQGAIAAGSIVDSHMIFLNRGDTNGGSANLLDLDAVFEFSGRILGTMSDIHGGARMVPSDFLGGIYTYANFNNRGLERSGQHKDEFQITGANDTFLNAQFNVTQPGDWMRVVTVAPVPVPAGLVLLVSGLAGFGALKRRKKA